MGRNMKLKMKKIKSLKESHESQPRKPRKPKPINEMSEKELREKIRELEFRRLQMEKIHAGRIQIQVMIRITLYTSQLKLCYNALAKLEEQKCLKVEKKTLKTK